MISFILAAALSGSAFTCTVTRVHDGDGPLWCAEGPKIRIAGIQAPDFESATPCREGRAGYVCDDRAARASQRTVSALVLGKRLTCISLEPSYSRIVARCRLPDGRDLSCAVLAAGAATRWDRYWRRYRMPACGSVAGSWPLSAPALGEKLDLKAVQMETAVDRDAHSGSLVVGKFEVAAHHLLERPLGHILAHRERPAIADHSPRQTRFLIPVEVLHV